MVVLVFAVVLFGCAVMDPLTGGGTQLGLSSHRSRGLLHTVADCFCFPFGFAPMNRWSSLRVLVGFPGFLVVWGAPGVLGVVLVPVVSLCLGCPGVPGVLSVLLASVASLGFLVVGVPRGCLCCFFVACCELPPYIGFFIRHRYARVLAPPFLYGWGATTRPLRNRRRGMLHAVADCSFLISTIDGLF